MNRFDIQQLGGAAGTCSHAQALALPLFLLCVPAVLIATNSSDLVFVDATVRSSVITRMLPTQKPQLAGRL